ncbi:MAG: nucleoside 2-deoxyribosyltransferase [Clostridia bacterium]|nr:nucleoside 2-deoxyribosyltransferase [Clostridia bacterium]
MKKIYLAGPDVFYPNSIEIGENHKRICEGNGFVGLYPLDNDIKGPSSDIKYDIVKANMASIESSDYIVANLSNFRGTEEHPSCDSGTAWECGYGLSKGKKVIAYTKDINSIPDTIIKSIDLVVNGDFVDAITIAKKTFFKHNQPSTEEIVGGDIINIDAEHPDIKDISAGSAFMLGYRCGKGMQCTAVISDGRSEVEKFGKVDSNGFNVDDFGQCANIMVECTCNIKKREMGLGEFDGK